MKLAVLDDYQGVAGSLADWASLPDGTETVFFGDHLTAEEDVARRLEGFDAVVMMRERTPIRRSLIERLPSLRLIVTTGMRNASLDVAAARERGIVVCGTDTGLPSTAELTWGLILALARGIVTEDRAMRDGRWQTGVGVDLAGRTLGVLGLGRLGGRVAAIGQAFGMDVIAWSQNLTAEAAEEVGVRRVERRELFARADVLTVHVVLSGRTRGLVGAAELAAMKPTAFLVNTSRGPIVDQAALLDALREGRIAGVGIDVYDEEPLPAGHPLLSAPRTVLTPHLGYVTLDSLGAMYRAAVEDVAAFLAGRPIRELS
jgi:phosphoglycerate dehydrogenase-like enzyme